MKKLFCVILVIFLTGCSSQKANEPKKQENSTNHTTSIKAVLIITVLAQKQALIIN